MANNRDLSQFASTVGYSGGNIGIGTATPGAVLEVFDATSNTIVNVKSGDSGAVLNLIDDSARSSIEQNGTTLKISSDTGAEDASSDIRLQVDGSSKMIIRDSGDVVTGVPAHDNQNNTGSRTVFTVADTTNGALLHLRGQSPAAFFDISSGGIGKVFLDSANFAIQSGTPASEGTERLSITSDGKFGINLTNPTRQLEIYNSSHATAALQSDTQSSLFFSDPSDTNIGQISYMHSGNYMYFRVNDGERLRITSGGDLLLGGHSEYTYDDTGATNVILDIYGGATAGKRGILSLSGRVGDNNGDIGTIWFNNDNNSGSGPGNTMKLSAVIQAKITTSDGNAGSDAGAYMQFMTKPEGGSVTERLQITSAGKIQVTGTRGGTLQPSDNDSLELYTSATSGNASTGGGITFYNHDGSGHEMGGVIHVVKQNSTDNNTQSDMLFGTRLNGSNVAYRARLTSHGSWETYSSTVNIDIANSQSSGNNEAFIYARYGSTGLSAGSLSFRVYTNGNVQNTNNSYGSVSDQNLKENIVDATSQWNDIKALQVRKYNFREATGHQTHTQLGLIAQEVETVSPGLVETTAVREGETCQDADGNQLESIKSINYSVLYMKAVKALQEAQTRIETLESQHTDLLARVTALEG